MALRNSLLALVVVLAPAVAHGQHPVEMGIVGRNAFSSNDLGLNNTLGGGLRLGARLVPRLYLEGEALLSSPTFARPGLFSGQTSWRNDFSARGVYYVPLSGKLDALVGGGYTFSYFQDRGGVVLNQRPLHSGQALAGLKLRMTETLSLRTEGTFNAGRLSGINTRFNQWGAQMGLSVGFGGRGQKAVVEVMAPPAPPKEVPVVYEVEPEPIREEAPVQEPIHVTLTVVHFALDQSLLTPMAKVKIREAVEKLAQDQEMVVDLNGHTDARGTLSYNRRLSERRARSVQDYMVSLGITVERISAYGFGETQPVATNTTAEGRAQNRRVEVVGKKN